MHSTSLYGLKLSVFRGVGAKALATDHRVISLLAKWTAVYSLVLFTLTLSHIIATRVGLDLYCMTCIFKKFIDLCDQTAGNKERLGCI